MRRRVWRVEVFSRRISASVVLFALRMADNSFIAALMTVRELVVSALSPFSVAVAVFMGTVYTRTPSGQAPRRRECPFPGHPELREFKPEYFLSPLQGLDSFCSLPQGGARFTSLALGYFLLDFQPWLLAVRRAPVDVKELRQGTFDGGVVEPQGKEAAPRFRGSRKGKLPLPHEPASSCAQSDPNAWADRPGGANLKSEIRNGMAPSARPPAGAPPPCPSRCG